MKRKKIGTALIAVLLVFSLAVPAAAVTYPDLQGQWAWAKPYMEDLAARGIMTGYSDGTMKPGNDITGAEALAMLSRLYDLTDDALGLIYDDYGSIAEEALPASLSWVFDEAAVCLASGAIRGDELKKLDFEKPIEKEVLSVLLVRAMLLTGSLPAAIPTFADTDQITAAYRPYVRLLVDLGIVTGDDRNNFSPHMNVSRAVVATMFSKALAYLEANDLMPELEEYTGQVKTEGIITQMTGDLLSMTGFDGFKRIWVVSEQTKLYVEGTAGSEESVVGKRAVVYIKTETGEVMRIIAAADSAVWVQAPLSGASTSAATRKVYLYDPVTKVSSDFVLASGVQVYLNGQQAALSELISGRFASMRLSGDMVTEIYLTSGDGEISGTLENISFDTITLLHVKAPDQTVYRFALNIAQLPNILRNGTKISIDRLRAGDALTVQIKACAVTGITVQGQEATITGELTAITTTAEGTSVSVRTETGTVSTYTLDNDAVIWSGRTEISLNDLKIGDEISLLVFGDTVSDVYLIQAEASATKVSGAVLTVDTTKRQIIIKYGSSLTYVNLKAGTPILMAATGASIALTGMPLEANIVAYGIYTSSNQFSATLIVIES